MTYDQHTRRTPPGPVAGIPWVEKVLAYVQSLGVPPDKISLGIPDYSDYWYATYDLAAGGHVTGNQLPYKTALGLLAQHDAKPAWDAEQKVNWARWENDGLFEYLFLEDADSFRSKLALVPKHHLRGFSVWVIGSEDARVWDLLTVPRRAAR
jgi:spore germination protein